ncbi:MAG: polymer-forming cytoskeletal protein [Candidatus Woesebacteria bacterium]|jgi:cytoskeletal protein CcmA (bactofilin family)
MTRKFLTSVIASVIFLFAFTPLVSAAGNDQVNTITLMEDETVEDDYFAAAENVVISGTVLGDVYAVGGQISVDGVIKGDLLAAGGFVTISGEVEQDVRVVAGDVSVRGKIGKNLSVAAGNVELTDSANVGGSVAVASGTLIINGNVNGKVKTYTGQLNVSENADLKGDVNYWSEQEANVSEQASVSGTLNKKEPGKILSGPSFNIERDRLESFKQRLSDTSRIVFFFSTLIIGLLMIKLFPKYSNDVVETLEGSTWRSFFLGLAILFGLPFALIILFITVIGIPIALILFAFYLIYIYLAKIFVMLWAGKYLSEKIDKKLSPNATFTLGLVAYIALSIVPYVGGIVRFSSLLAGLGAMTITCKNLYSSNKKA